MCIPLERVDGVSGLGSHRVSDNDRAEEMTVASDHDLGSRVHIRSPGCHCLNPMLS